MIQLLAWIAVALIQVVTGAAHVRLLIDVTTDRSDPDHREYFGGACEWRFVELNIDDKWYESKPVKCAAPRRP